MACTSVSTSIAHPRSERIFGGVLLVVISIENPSLLDELIRPKFDPALTRKRLGRSRYGR
jgi:hypothetical protein